VRELYFRSFPSPCIIRQAFSQKVSVFGKNNGNSIFFFKIKRFLGFFPVERVCEPQEKVFVGADLCLPADLSAEVLTQAEALAQVGVRPQRTGSPRRGPYKNCFSPLPSMGRGWGKGDAAAVTVSSIPYFLPSQHMPSEREYHYAIFL